jgi:hypothetical protein
VQSWKQDSRIASVDEGMQIDPSDEHQQNADSPNLETREPGSKVKVESCQQ